MAPREKLKVAEVTPQPKNPAPVLRRIPAPVKVVLPELTIPLA
jgi:hypothetical protein